MPLAKRTSWISSPDDEKMSDTLIGYWVQFAKTSAPNGPGLPRWPAYDPKVDRCQELGRNVGQIPTPHAATFGVFEDVLKEKLRSAK